MSSAAIDAGNGRPQPTGRTVVIGVGNPILGDDGVGWRIAQELDRRLTQDRSLVERIGLVDIDQLDVGGLRLMEHLVGYSTAILVDASCDGRQPGTVRSAPLDSLPARSAAHLDSAHDATLTLAIAAGRALGADLPQRLDFVGVSVAAQNVSQFSETLSEPVAAAVTPAIDVIVGLLEMARDA